MADKKSMLVLLVFVVLGGCGDASSVQPRGEDADGWENATYVVVEAPAGQFDAGLEIPADEEGVVSVTFEPLNYHTERACDGESPREK